MSNHMASYIGQSPKGTRVQKLLSEPHSSDIFMGASSQRHDQLLNQFPIPTHSGR